MLLEIQNIYENSQMGMAYCSIMHKQYLYRYEV